MLRETNVGWIRYFGGTSNNYYDWKLGTITKAMNAQLVERRQDMTYVGMETMIGSGGMHFSEYVDMAGKVGAKIIITVNTFTDEVQSIEDLAKYVKDNQINC